MIDREAQDIQLDNVLDQVDDIISPEWMTLDEAGEWLDGLIYRLQVRREAITYDLKRADS